MQACEKGNRFATHLIGERSSASLMLRSGFAGTGVVTLRESRGQGRQPARGRCANHRRPVCRRAGSPLRCRLGGNGSVLTSASRSTRPSSTSCSAASAATGLEIDAAWKSVFTVTGRRDSTSAKPRKRKRLQLRPDCAWPVRNMYVLVARGGDRDRGDPARVPWGCPTRWGELGFPVTDVGKLKNRDVAVLAARLRSACPSHGRRDGHAVPLRLHCARPRSEIPLTE